MHWTDGRTDGEADDREDAAAANEQADVSIKLSGRGRLFILFANISGHWKIS